MTNISNFKGTNCFETLGISAGAGTSVSSGNGSGIKGSWTTLGTTTFAYDGIIIQTPGYGALRILEIDIGFGATPDVAVSSTVYIMPTTHAGAAIHLPVKIPSGAALKMRFATQAGSTATNSFSAVGYQHNSWNRGFTYAEQLNTLSSGSPVTGLALPGDTTQTAWTQLIASTANDYAALAFDAMYVTGTSVGTTQVAIDFATGAAAAESQFYTRAQLNDISGASIAMGDRVIVPVAIPKGSRVSFRLQASAGTSVNVFYPLLLGFVP